MCMQRSARRHWVKAGVINPVSTKELRRADPDTLM